MNERLKKWSTKQISRKQWKKELLKRKKINEKEVKEQKKIRMKENEREMKELLGKVKKIWRKKEVIYDKTDKSKWMKDEGILGEGWKR